MKLQDADLELLVDSAHGIYIPKVYWERYKEYYEFLPYDKQLEFSQDLSNPENEWYNDSWCELIDNYTITNDNGVEFVIMQLDGDVCAISKEQCEQIDWDSEY